MKQTKKVVKKITKQQNEKALEAYDKAIKLDPNNVQAYINKEKMLVNLKRDDEKVLKLFANFLRKSTAIMEDAIKETREKHPNLFKSP